MTDSIETYESYETSLLRTAGKLQQKSKLASSRPSDVIKPTSQQPQQNFIRQSNELIKANPAKKKMELLISSSGGNGSGSGNGSGQVASASAGRMPTSASGDLEASSEGHLRSLRSLRKKVGDFLAAKSLLLQTIVALLVLCVPGNVVTFMVKEELRMAERNVTMMQQAGLSYRPPRATNPLHAESSSQQKCREDRDRHRDVDLGRDPSSASLYISVTANHPNGTYEFSELSRQQTASILNFTKTMTQQICIDPFLHSEAAFYASLAAGNESARMHVDAMRRKWQGQVRFFECMHAGPGKDVKYQDLTSIINVNLTRLNDLSDEDQAKVDKIRMLTGEFCLEEDQLIFAEAKSRNKSGNDSDAETTANNSSSFVVASNELAFVNHAMACIVHIQASKLKQQNTWSEPNRNNFSNTMDMDEEDAKVLNSFFNSEERQRTSEKDSSSSSSSFRCYQRLDEYNGTVGMAYFWLDGIGLSLTGGIGLFGNVMTFIVLRRRMSYIESTSNFNKLLMTLALIDSLLILFFMVDVAVFINASSCEPLWYSFAFPHFFYPGKRVVLSCSIFMVVAISAERYKAICYPLRHRPSSWQYICLVLCVSLFQNIPKFLEYELVDFSHGSYQDTPLMQNGTYIQFRGWWDDIVSTGLLPFIALVFFNLRIYWKIRPTHLRIPGNSQQQFKKECSLMSSPLSRSQSSRSRVGSPHFQQQQQQDALGCLTHHQQRKQRTKEKEAARHASIEDTGDSMSNCNVPIRAMQQRRHVEQHASLRNMCSCPLCREFRANRTNKPNSDVTVSCNPADHQLQQQQQTGTTSSSFRPRVCSYCLHKNCKVERAALKRKTGLKRVLSSCCCRIDLEGGLNGPGRAGEGGSGRERSASMTPEMEETCLTTGTGCLARIASEFALGQSDEIEEVVAKRPDIFPSAGALLPMGNSTLNRRTLHRYASGQLHIRRRREKSTLILVSIVVIFLSCHVFRLSLQGYMVTHPSSSTAQHHTYCVNQGLFHVPVALYVMLSASNLFLVVNSSVNFIVYCLVEESFRKELLSLWTDLGAACVRMVGLRFFGR